MDFDFSFEQQLIGKSVRSALAELPPVMNRAPYPYGATELTRTLAELGVWGTGDVEEPGLGFVDAVVVAMEVGRALPAAPVIEQLAASLVLPSAQTELARAIAAGAMTTVAVSGGFERRGEGLRGQIVVPFAAEAVAVLAPVSGREWGVFSSENLSLSPLESMDITADVFRAEALSAPSGVFIPGRGAVSLADVLELLAMAEIVGSAEIALEKTVDYVRERKQFGKPIGTNQAVKHLAADAASDVEIMKVGIEYAGWALDQAANDETQTEEARIALLTARSFVGEHARLVLERCVQMHGGIAFTWDFGLHRYLRRILYRTNTIIRPLESRDQIASLVLAEA